MSVFAPYGKIPGGWPTGITQSRGPGHPLTPGAYMAPYDPYFNQRGEAGFFHDTALGNLAMPVIKAVQRWKQRRQLRGLGAIPTDFEISPTMNYTPVMSNWIATRQGYLTPPRIPPRGDPPGGYPIPVQPWDNGGERTSSPYSMRYYDSKLHATDPYWHTTTLAGLREGDPGIVPPQPAASVEDVMFAMNAHNDRVFALALVSTTAVTISAILGVFRTLRLIRVGD